LRKLHLNNNQIGQIKGLDNLTKLEELNLKNNQIKLFPESLKKLEMDGNPSGRFKSDD